LIKFTNMKLEHLKFYLSGHIVLASNRIVWKLRLVYKIKPHQNEGK